MPPTGPGWDEKRAYIGVPYQNASQSNAASKAFGLNLIGVDYKEVANAIIADVNKRGGLLGRTLTPVYVEFPPDPGPTGQSQCEAWTQDKRVYAVADSFYPADTLYACLAKAKLPFANGSFNVIDQKVLDRYKPYFRKMTTVSNTTLLPTWLNRLTANGYFTKWNTTAGGPGGELPVKTGLICRDDSEAERNGCSDLERLLKQRGYSVEAFHISGTAVPGGDAVLKFSSAGVTHVFSQTTDILFFMQSAEQQGYRPRYGLTTTNVLGLLTASAPKQQLVGALGVGSAPLADVAKPPPLGPGRARCQKALKDAQVDVDPGYLAQTVAQGLCDEIYLFADAALVGRGFGAPQVVDGLARVKSVYQAGASFATGLSATRFDVPSAVRDLGYDTGCACFRFLSTTNWAS